MPERPKPTKRIMLELCGRSQHLIESVHHGLFETPLNEFYSNLDLNEAVAFAAGSWDIRNGSVHNLRQNIDSRDIYDIFSEAFAKGMPWLNGNMQISADMLEKYERLNPFEGRNLRARLQRIPPEAVKTLKRGISEAAHEYVFECQYPARKAARGGDNYNLEVMHFQNVYPRRGRIVPAFAAEVAGMLSDYPRGYEPLPEKPAQAAPAKPSEHVQEQPELFR